jgi:hypothetical protein
MTNLKDMWRNFSVWVSGTANTVVSANVTPIIEPVGKVIHKVEVAAHDLVAQKAPPAPKKSRKKKKD